MGFKFKNSDELNLDVVFNCQPFAIVFGAYFCVGVKLKMCLFQIS